MESTLKIALIQVNSVWENISKNLSNLSDKMNAVDKDVDIVILPELFSTGFTMHGKQYAETMQGTAVAWMLDKARDKGSLVLGSLLINDGGKLYNRLVVAFPQGEIKCYDKRHLFSFAGEEKVFTAGSERLVFEYKGFKICPLVCYDLRFPVWSRNTEEIDLLIYVANWPNTRMHAWDTLLKARAIENLCYVAAVNRVGVDNNNLVYTGHSSVVDALGKEILSFETNEENIKTVVLEKEHVSQTRSTFAFLDDRDSFEVI